MGILGKTFTSTRCGEFAVIEFVERVNKNYYYRVRFATTGNIVKAEQRNIKKGRVGDPKFKNIYGVALKGTASTVEPLLNKLAFKRWYSMIERCYNPRAIMYKSYGAKGVRVSDDWLCFDNFLADIPNIPGYNEEKYLLGEIQLDKDTITEGNKLYSSKTCCFINSNKNKRQQVTKKKPFIAISPTGESYIFDYQQSCADKLGLTARSIGKVLHGQLKSHKGWKFKYLAK